MKILLIELLILEIISSTYLSSSSGNNNRTIEIFSPNKGSSLTSTCSIVKIIDILACNELFLFCYEYEFPSNDDFYNNFNFHNNFKFILKSFFAFRLISKDMEENRSNESIEINQINKEKQELNKKIETEFFFEYLSENDNFSEKTFTNILKDNDFEFLYMGNLIKEQKTLSLYTEETWVPGYDVKSYIDYPLGQNGELHDKPEGLIRLEIVVFTSYKFDLFKKFQSRFHFFFLINNKVKESYSLPTDDILNIKFKEKLIEKSKMHSNEEGKELYFRFPKENEKDKMLKELTGLFDYSVLLSSIKTEENNEISDIKIEDNSNIPKEDKNKENRNFLFYFTIFLTILFVALIFGMGFKYIIFGNKNIKL